MALKYSESGVDIHAADDWVGRLGKRLRQSEKIKSGIGSYAAVYASSSQEWVALSCDGVGSKLLWTLEGLGSFQDLGQDLVAMNSNDLLCVGATPKLFLDYLAIGSKELLSEGGSLNAFVEGLEQACEKENMWLVGGETAQMPELYKANHFDCAGFAFGFLKPSDHLNVDRLLPGQSVWGLPSVGPHSNGFSLLRKLFDVKNDKKLIQEFFMPPTRLYGKDFFQLREQVGAKLCGAFHMTGSGIWNLLRAQPTGRHIGFDLREMNWKAPLWLEEIQKRTPMGLSDLWSTFNCGFGFIVILEELDKISEGYLRDAGFEKLGHLIADARIRMPFGDLKEEV